jgi:PleD family two-component response regulator
MERADQALYAAKQGGRNQVRVADMKATPSKQHA